MQNTTLLDALSTRRMFIVWKLVPKELGGFDKVPTSPLSLLPINSQDAAHWMLPHEAKTWVDLLGPEYGVGMVFYEGCGFFFLDFDKCRDGAGWLPHVQSFMDRFPGAATEVSVSNNGKHLFGSFVGEPPLHGVKNKAYKMEAYTRGRFAALTGTEAAGSILTDHTEALRAFLTQFFPTHGDEDKPVEWTSGPCAEWRGPTDDVELHRRAMRSAGAKAAFGGRAVFADLYDGRIEALARSFPSPQHDAFDRSAADLAFANHLAFWTGKDCERMERFMRASALRRDKYDRADGYLRNTILNACASQTEVYAEPEAKIAAASTIVQTVLAPSVTVNLAGEIVPPDPPAAETPAPPSALPPPALPAPKEVRVFAPGQMPEPSEYATLSDQLQIFRGMAYVTDSHKIQLADGTSLDKSRFDVTFGGGVTWCVTADGQRPCKSAWDCYTASEIHSFPKVMTQFFSPAHATGYTRMNEGELEINCYKPIDIRRVQGDPEMFLWFLRTLIPNTRDQQILLSWMAAAVQNVGTKFMWAPFIQGVKGNGKTTLGKIMQYCFSERYTHWAKSSELAEKFNDSFTNKLLLILDEAKTQDQIEAQEILKILVTSDRVEVRAMYKEKMMKNVCYNLMLLSNFKNAVRVDRDERRFAVLYCAQQKKEHLARDGLTTEFFTKSLRPWLAADGYAIVYNYLMNYQIPDEFNPTGSCVVAPDTSSTAEAVSASLGSIEQEIIHAIQSKVEGFRDGWISSVAVDHLLARIGREKAIPRSARAQLVLDLGYAPHPSLPNGFLATPLSDGNTPYLYVVKDHAWAVDYLTADQVRDGFVQAQKK